jgi:hypothetical protein
MSIRVRVDSEVEGIESIVSFATSLVKKAKIWCFYTRDIANFEKKVFE